MTEVYPRGNDQHGLKQLALAIIKASTVHIGAAAGAAALRDELTRSRMLSVAEFNECFAVARLTPGTTLLALQTLLGFRVARWRGAAIALILGAVLPSLIAVMVVSVYVLVRETTIAVALMGGAKAGALAVFVWAAIRLARPVVTSEPVRAAMLAAGVAILVVFDVVGPFAVLVASGAVSALAFRGGE